MAGKQNSKDGSLSACRAVHGAQTVFAVLGDKFKGEGHSTGCEWKLKAKTVAQPLLKGPGPSQTTVPYFSYLTPLWKAMSLNL